MPFVNPGHAWADGNQAQFWPCFRQVVRGLDGALEIGAGKGRNLLEFRQYGKGRTVGVELCEAYTQLTPAREQGVEFIVGDARVVVPKLLDKSFDLVMFIDSLEHFYPGDANKLLGHAERLARRRILIWVPEGRYVQDAEHYGEEDAADYPYQVGQDHHSYWEKEDLEQLGYDVAVWKNYHRDKAKPGWPITLGAMFCVKEVAV